MTKGKIFTVNGFTGNMSQISKRYGISLSTLSDRLNKGMAIEEALDIPVLDIGGKGKIYTVYGFTGNLSEISEKFNIKRRLLSKRLNNGMTIEEAVDTPVKKHDNIYTINNFTGNTRQISEKFNINYNSLKTKLNQGFSIEECINYFKNK